MTKAKEMSPAHVALDEDLPGGLRVSTVRLPFDHQFAGGPPLWYETMVFPKNSYWDLAMDRYTTEDEARAGHEAMVARVMSGEITDTQTDEEREMYSPEGIRKTLADIMGNQS
jgi:hypothetical protein